MERRADQEKKNRMTKSLDAVSDAIASQHLAVRAERERLAEEFKRANEALDAREAWIEEFATAFEAAPRRQLADRQRPGAVEKAVFTEVNSRVAPVSADAVAKTLGFVPASVRAALRRLAKDGKISEAGAGLYCSRKETP